MRLLSLAGIMYDIIVYVSRRHNALPSRMAGGALKLAGARTQTTVSGCLTSAVHGEDPERRHKRGSGEGGGSGVVNSLHPACRRIAAISRRVESRWRSFTLGQSPRDSAAPPTHRAATSPAACAAFFFFFSIITKTQTFSLFLSLPPSLPPLPLK